MADQPCSLPSVLLPLMGLEPSATGQSLWAICAQGHHARWHSFAQKAVYVDRAFCGGSHHHHGTDEETKHSNEPSNVLKVTQPVSQTQTQILSLYGDGEVNVHMEMI